VSRWTVASMIAAGVGLAGCGSVTHFADNPRPAAPVDLSVYVGNRQVSASPSRVGAGPVIFYVANNASRSELVTVQPVHAGGASATTGPINPGGTAQVQLDLAQGAYTVGSAAAGSSTGVRSPKLARLRITAPRASSNNAVLQP
jgi:hypothetical protein